jgi:hypothetical protein
VAIGAVGHQAVGRTEVAFGAERERVLRERLHREAGTPLPIGFPDVEAALQVAGDDLERAVAIEVAD